jgi:hypothetical protein
MDNTATLHSGVVEAPSTGQSAGIKHAIDDDVDDDDNEGDQDDNEDDEDAVESDADDDESDEDDNESNDDDSNRAHRAPVETFETCVAAQRLALGRKEYLPGTGMFADACRCWSAIQLEQYKDGISWNLYRELGYYHIPGYEHGASTVTVERVESCEVAKKSVKQLQQLIAVLDASDRVILLEYLDIQSEACFTRLFGDGFADADPQLAFIREFIRELGGAKLFAYKQYYTGNQAVDEWTKEQCFSARLLSCAEAAKRGAESGRRATARLTEARQACKRHKTTE